MNGRMDEWMDGWMTDRQTDERTDRQMNDRQMYPEMEDKLINYKYIMIIMLWKLLYMHPAHLLKVSNIL